MQCDPHSVDLTIPIQTQDLDDNEVVIHRNFIHYVCLIKNIRRMNDVHAKLKSRPDWRHSPQFMESSPSLDQWLYDLPPDLHVQVVTDLAHPAPRLETHFAGNLQVYYHLARIMLHRPALAYGKAYGAGGEWRQHMGICTNAAKSICRLVEVIFEEYGMLGLQVMSRGVNFTIYALLTGAMIHLVFLFLFLLHLSFHFYFYISFKSRTPTTNQPPVKGDFANFKCRLQQHVRTPNSTLTPRSTSAGQCGYSRTASIARHRPRRRGRLRRCARPSRSTSTDPSS